MLKEIHFLLTYTCNYECDHCFLFCGPRARGTFTLDQVETVLAEAKKIDSVDGVYFEGGEPLLYHPLLVQSIRAAHEAGLRTGLVSNAYMSTSVGDAELWLEPLIGAGLDYLSASDDSFHGAEGETPGKRTLIAAQRLGLAGGAITIDPPQAQAQDSDREKGDPVIGGGVMFRGRAVETLTQGLPTRNWADLTECPHEKLADPSRVHVDAYGNVMVCQGISLGDMWRTPLSGLIRNYRPETHPICGPLLRGGPAELVRVYNLDHAPGYVDECHLCFRARQALMTRFPEELAPAQVYG